MMDDKEDIISLTLPITDKEGLNIKSSIAREIGLQYRGSYHKADPFPHIIFDNFLPTDLCRLLLNNFPKESDNNVPYENHNYSGIQKNKKQTSPYDCNEFSIKIFSFFNSAGFIQFLEGLTGIDGLISDPYFVGGGFHEISSGGSLNVHADFRINEKLNLQRRLNVLIYLNVDWLEEYGGYLELWDKKMKNKVRTIKPIFNRCVIFNTDEHSYHGHPEKIKCPDTITRKSIALYYYSASKLIYNELPSHSTMYMNRPLESYLTKRSTMTLKIQNYIREIVPPIIYRRIFNFRNKK
tara:strand:- start:139 stop:1023 length:885 start_codon:yes stop_codon:yes gene_type:complete